MNELALFVGAGGGQLGSKLLGWRTVCAVEIDAYARNRLLDRQADGCLDRFPIWDDVTTFDGRPWRGYVDVVSGGFPCQDISAAGKGAGVRDGKRSGLWAEYARIIGEVQPRFVWVENSPMLTLRGLDVVLGDLSALGYDACWGVVSAADAGAPHLRERIWILAYAEQPGLEGHGADAGEPQEPESGYSGALADALRDGTGKELRSVSRGAGPKPEGARRRQVPESRDSGENVSDAEGGGLAVLRRAQGEPGHADGVHEDVADADGIDGRTGTRGEDGAETNDGSWWATEPDVGRVAHGVASRVDRLRCIGNGQVPQAMRLAWEILRSSKVREF